MASNPVVCASGCAETLSAVKSSICNPETRRGEISRIFIGRRGNPFDAPATPVTGTEVNDPDAWTARIDQSAVAADAIVIIHVIGEKARPEEEELEMSLGRKKVLKRTHTVSFVSDEFNDENHDFFRATECGGIFDVWYETSDGLLFGNADGVEIGIQASIKAGMVIPRERSGAIVWEGELTWEAKHTETFIDSPVPDAPEPV